MDVQTMVRLGEAAILNRLVYHHSIQSALLALDQSANHLTPTIDDRMLQVSLGGDPDLLVVGKFLPCQRLSSNPDIRIRCACGLRVKDTPRTSQLKGFLRCRCKNKA
mmetsp:Transcript_35897/g.75572  ORF Transcript_35897/g.75572 Transcript_35897/m.75572 type:complete len:107 (+) Transcript_35897:923-1243(+)